MLAGNWQMMTTARIREKADFDAFMLPWKRLAGQSLSPAGLNSPEMILPLLKNIKGAELAVVVQGKELLFALPVQKRRALSSNWITPLTVIGTPHLDKEFPAASLITFINGLQQPLLLHSVSMKGCLWDCLGTRDVQFSVLNTWARAGLKPVGTFESWMESNFSPKRRKEYRRLGNRLAEQGDYTALTFSQGDDTDMWADELLALEAAGWKGKRGTALAADGNLQSALKEACQLLGAAGKLRFWKLTFNGKAIASMYAVVEGDQAWLGKIAYDESFAKFSPGVLLILHATEQLFAESHIKLIDSCAIPGHPMIENIWRDRIEVADVMIAPLTISKLRFAATKGAEQLRRTARNFARDAYYHLKGTKRS
jgi:CelD/BcsL family acetyltransferase involved in cellulose biosynthesis